jgi:hypothetical protein
MSGKGSYSEARKEAIPPKTNTKYQSTIGGLRTVATRKHLRLSRSSISINNQQRVVSSCDISGLNQVMHRHPSIHSSECNTFVDGPQHLDLGNDPRCNLFSGPIIGAYRFVNLGDEIAVLVDDGGEANQKVYFGILRNMIKHVLGKVLKCPNKARRIDQKYTKGLSIAVRILLSRASVSNFSCVPRATLCIFAAQVFKRQRFSNHELALSVSSSAQKWTFPGSQQSTQKVRILERFRESMYRYCSTVFYSTCARFRLYLFMNLNPGPYYGFRCTVRRVARAVLPHRGAMGGGGAFCLMPSSPLLWMFLPS